MIIDDVEVNKEVPTLVSGKRTTVGLTVVFLFFVLALFFETAWSMVSIWIRSETFTHGFLIIPIVLWMVWERKEQLKQITPAPQYIAATLLFGAGFLWLLAFLVDVLVIQQYALVSMAVFGLWMLLGNRICWAIAFPLAYLLFLVPVGEGLVPAMMEFTATFTVAMVKLSGVPVYREGLFFYLPSGNWSVVEACSGVRYLIASVTLGCLYAYLTYSKTWKRLVFILISVVVPIIANGLRAYLIVMLGHWSDMEIATGVDHLIYGWLFFGLVMLILFVIGGLWRDKEKPSLEAGSKEVVSAKSGNAERGQSSRLSILKPFVSAIAIVIIWPLLAYAIEHRQTPLNIDELKLPEQFGNWKQQKSEFLGSWVPSTGGADRIVQGHFSSNGETVALVIHQYLQQKQGRELVSGQNLLIPEGVKKWIVLSSSTRKLSISDNNLPVKQTVIRGGRGADFMVWSWYRVGSRHSSNDYETKLYEAWLRLTFSRQDSVRIFVAVPLSDGLASIERAEKTLKRYLHDALPEVTRELDQSVGLD